jgi:integrase
MGELRDRMDADLRLAGYSPRTRECYLQRAKAFAAHYMRSPEQMGETEIRQYLLYVVEERQISRSGYTQIRAALTFLYTTTLRRPIEVARVPVPRRRVVLPVVLRPAEVQAVLGAIRSATYRVLAMVVYASGLRTAEASRLRSALTSSRTRTRSRMASSARVGTRTAMSSPARCSPARLRASMRSVFTLRPERRGMSVGAITSHSAPRA